MREGGQAHYNYVSLNKPVPRFASSLAEGASVASARPPALCPCAAGAGGEGEEQGPRILARAHGAQSRVSVSLLRR